MQPYFTFEERAALDKKLRKLTADILASDESDLPALIREFEESPLGRRVEGIECAVRDVRQCRCAAKICGHTCIRGCDDSCQGDQFYHCEDCFAFVPNLLSFCHCAQEIVVL